jgi:hypothetical protein
MNMPSTRNALIIAVGLVAGSLLIGCCIGGGLMRVWQGPPGGPVVTGRVTMKHFETIKGGGAKTYGDVVRTIGFDGKNIRQPTVTDGTSVFIWTNPDGSNLTCQFVGEQFNGAEQHGLK